MKPIKQEDPFGCGVACVAFVVNSSYKDCLELFEKGKKKALEQGFVCREIIEALRSKNLIYEYRYIKTGLRKKIYRRNTIVFIKRSKRYSIGHYLVRVNSKWMDPWINFPNERIKAGFRKRLPGKPIYMIYPFCY